MKNKLICSEYDEEFGISTVGIQNKYGTFFGQAVLSPEDADIGSKIAGCRYAEVRAENQCLRVQLKEAKNELKALNMLARQLEKDESYDPASFAIKTLNGDIKQIQNRIDDIKFAIQDNKNYIETSAKERDELLSKYRKGKTD